MGIELRAHNLFPAFLLATLNRAPASSHSLCKSLTAHPGCESLNAHPLFFFITLKPRFE